MLVHRRFHTRARCAWLFHSRCLELSSTTALNLLVACALFRAKRGPGRRRQIDDLNMGTWDESNRNARLTFSDFYVQQGLTEYSRYSWCPLATRSRAINALRTDARVSLSRNLFAKFVCAREGFATIVKNRPSAKYRSMLSLSPVLPLSLSLPFVRDPLPTRVRNELFHRVARTPANTVIQSHF